MSNPVRELVEPTRILVADHYPLISGGQMSLLRLMGAADQSRYQFIVACAEESGPFKDAVEESGIQTVAIPFNSPGTRFEKEGKIYREPLKLLATLPRVLASVRKLAAAADRFGVHLYYGNSFKASAILSCLATYRARPFASRLRTSRAYSSHGWIDRLICRQSDLLLANSTYVAKTFESIAGASGKMSVVYNYGGVSEELRARCVADGRRIRGELEIDGNTMLIGQVGRISARKRAEDVVRGVAELTKRRSDFVCVFVGDIDEGGTPNAVYRNAHELAHALGVSERVKFIGHREDALSIIGAMDVMVLASQDEPMARVIIEALGLGTPILASDHGGNSEVLKHGENAMLFPLGDSLALAENLQRMLSSYELRRFLSANGSTTYSKTFSREVTIERELSLLRGLVSREMV